MRNDDGRSSRLGRPFWTLLLSSSASNLADGVFRIALPLIAIRFTRSPATFGALALTRSVPWLLLALPVGAWIDRWDRRVTMVSSNLLRVIATVVLAMALVFDRGSLAVIFLAAVAAGMAEVFYDTAAQSMLPAVVQRQQLGRANSRLAILERGMQEYVAPALGGLLVGLSVVLGAGVPAALWLAALLGLLVLRGSFRPERTGDRATVLADVREGLTLVWRRPVLRTLAGIVGLGNLTTSASMAVLVLYAVGPHSPMGMREVGYGALFLISGVGAIVAAATNGWIVARLGDARTMRWATPALVLFSLGPAISVNPLMVGAFMVLGSFANMTFNIPSVSYRQRVTPDAFLGRVNSVFRFVGWGTMPLGALLGGLIGEAFGVRAVFIAMTALGAVLVLPAQLIRQEQMDEPPRQ